jgi:four helix bundle protein
MSKIYFDHEKLRVYQDALRFVAFADPILHNVPAKVAARDQLDRASTSIVLNIAEGNGKRSHPDRCRFFDIARGSALECAACLDVLVVKQQLGSSIAAEGKELLAGIVSMLIGLLETFGGMVREPEQAPYGDASHGVNSDRDPATSTSKITSTSTIPSCPSPLPPSFPLSCSLRSACRCC